MLTVLYTKYTYSKSKQTLIDVTACGYLFYRNQITISGSYVAVRKVVIYYNFII